MSGQCLELEMLVATEKEVFRGRSCLWLLLQCQNLFIGICYGDQQIGSLVQPEL